MGRFIAVFLLLCFLSIGSVVFGQSYGFGSSSSYSSTSAMGFQTREASPGSTSFSSGFGVSHGSPSSSGFLPSEHVPGSLSQSLDGRQGTQNPYGEGNPFPPGTPPNPYGFFGIVSGYR